MQKHILAILATWRITQILYDENAPFDLAAKLRQYAFKHGMENVVPDYDTGKMIQANSPFWREVNKALSCTWCMSVWIGVAVAISIRVNPLWGFAYSAASLLFGKLFNAIPVYIHGEVESQVLE